MNVKSVLAVTAVVKFNVAVLPLNEIEVIVLVSLPFTWTKKFEGTAVKTEIVSEKFKAIDNPLLARVAEDNVGVTASTAQLGALELYVTFPLFVTVLFKPELSFKRLEELAFSIKTLEFVTGDIGLVGVVKYEEYRDVPFTKWKLVICPENVV